MEHTLEPLVYIGPAEGNPKAEWKLKSPREILALKICDMAMGSGAFLVQCCRYLAERLVEAWQILEDETNPASKNPTSEIRNPKFIITPEGDLSAGSSAERLLPADPAERLAIARRYVADRCLYGVDINPMAVEMAKLSLWLITLQQDRPFTFLDHALKCGDSLLGISNFEQLSRFSLDSSKEHQVLVLQGYEHHIKAATKLRQHIESLPSDTNDQIEHKNRFNLEAESHLSRLKLAASVLVSAKMQNLKGEVGEMARVKAHLAAYQAVEYGQLSDAHVIAAVNLANRRPFHWPLEFPEVFNDEENEVRTSGFDAFVGNPPFMGGQKITGGLGTDYRDYLVENIARGQRGSADYCSYFFLRSHALLNPNHGMAGLIATNTIAQGDSREVGMDQIITRGSIIPRAISSRPWPGVAALEVAHVWLRRGKWEGDRILDDKVVSGIT
ncbi:MAG: restriction endonuclease, partial [Verrucomicrobiaceae bacterium]